MNDCTPKAQGKVSLVGAGPGDPELLTLKAVRAISEGSLLLVDDLVNDEVLTHANPTARVIRVGKRGGCPSTPQAFIEKLMITQAREGQCVVRLKGGDPFIFGRGGEEVAALLAAGIRVEVVNGITSGLAALSSLNVALTHRDHAHGVVFITGHAKPGDAGPDWAALSHAAHRAKLTLVIYMGMAHAGAIEAGLLTALPADTPAAVIQNATLPSQSVAHTTLGNLARSIAHNNLSSPSVMVVGNVLQGIAAAHSRADLHPVTCLSA